MRTISFKGFPFSLSAELVGVDESIHRRVNVITPYPHSLLVPSLTHSSCYIHPKNAYSHILNEVT